MDSDNKVLRGLWGEAIDLATTAGSYLRQFVIASTAFFWRSKIDVILAALLGLGAAAYAVWRFGLFDFSVLSSVVDLWFEADVPRIVEANADRWSKMHYRTAVHPLFSLLVSLPLTVLAKLGLDMRTLAAVLVGAAAFLFTSIFYAAARSIGLRRPDAVVATFLMLSTSAAMFWLPAPESYVLGGATILFPLIWLAAPRGEHDLATGPAQSALALSITVTNWTAGLAAAILGLGLRRGLRVSAIGFLVVVGLTILQQALFPNAGKFFYFGEESRYITVQPGMLSQRVASLFTQPLAPTPTAIFTKTGEMTVGFAPHSLFANASAWFWIALLGWLALSALSIEAIFKKVLATRILTFLLFIVVVQFPLYLLYGDGFFLYAMNLVPFMVLLAAIPCLGRYRVLALALMGITALASGAHNFVQIERATAVVNSYPERVLEAQGRLTERGAVLWAMHQRPNDPWPSGAGHFVLGAPGAPLQEKGYMEPGGSFSPRVGGPGLALWVFDRSGALETTSDQQDILAAKDRFEFVDGDVAPSVVVQTPNYRAQWRQVAPNRWLLNARAPEGDRSLALSVRAVGPAAGPIHDIVAEGDDTVRVDSCWVLRVRDGRIAYLGEEGLAGWRDETPASVPARHRSRAGWAAARIAAPSSGSLQAEVEQTCVRGSDALWPPQGGVKVSPSDLPIATLISNQSAHLLMGFEGRQTRPGDPVSYPLQWLRDGGYSVVAMARAGRLDVARDLVVPFAELDFFGGFGSEADSPGIALWALNEVATAARDPALDHRLWPHVRRKADFILELLKARSEVRRPFDGPATVSRPDLNLVARAASNGLINGRMDWHEPTLFVNAFAWRGLEDAAHFADRVDAPADAARWREAAGQLRLAWRQKFRVDHLHNERTTASLLWPTRVATPDKALVRTLLALTPATFSQRPDWTYFDVARAHQYLVLGDVDEAWTMIDALMKMSAVPDLGVLWEGRGGEKDDWRNLRGWVHGAPLMPHYWSAAELMLFAIEGLAFVDEGEGDALVIGAGIRREWLRRPIAVEGVGTLVGSVDWRWDGDAVTVVLDDPAIPLRLGPAFPAGTRIIRLLR